MLLINCLITYKGDLKKWSIFLKFLVYMHISLYDNDLLNKDAIIYFKCKTNIIVLWGDILKILYPRLYFKYINGVKEYNLKIRYKNVNIQEINAFADYCFLKIKHLIKENSPVYDILILNKELHNHHIINVIKKSCNDSIGLIDINKLNFENKVYLFRHAKIIVGTYDDDIINVFFVNCNSHIVHYDCPDVINNVFTIKSICKKMCIKYIKYNDKTKDETLVNKLKN